MIFENRAPTLSLVDIFKMDDATGLHHRIDSDPSTINLLVRVTFAGQPVWASAVAAAVHYRAEKCLQVLPIKYDTFSAKPGSPSAAHFACEEQWEPGVKFLMDRQVPRNMFDGNSKTPLAYVAEHENLSIFRLFLRYFMESNQMDGLKSVALSKEGSLNFLSYCVEARKTKMIQACNLALKYGFISKQEVCSAIIRWKRLFPNDEMPLFLRIYNRAASLELRCQHSNIFSPLLPKSEFAQISSFNAIPIYNSIKTVNELFDLVNFNAEPLPNNFFKSNIDSEYIFYPEKLPEDHYNHFSQYHILKQYFTTFIGSLMTEVDGFLVPKQEWVTDEIFKLFGIALAHIGFNGCHYHFEKPLSPLIYAALAYCPNQLENLTAQQIEEYALIANKKKLLDIRKKALLAFLNIKAFNSFTDFYDKILKNYWNSEIRKHRQKLENLYEGFYQITKDKKFEDEFKFDENDYTDPKNCFNLFRYKISKMDIPTIRFWYEGLQYTDGIIPHEGTQLKHLNISKHILIKEYGDSNEINSNFKSLFKRWLKVTDDNTVISFLVAIMGNRVFLPIESKYKTLHIIHSARISSIAFILLPEQDAAIPAMNTIDDITNFAYNILNNGAIEYAKKIEFLQGLTPL